MKSLRPLLFIAAAALTALPLSAQVTANPDLPEVIILPNDGPGADPAKPDRVVWSTEPGIRYQLEYSEDLEDWDVIEGFPSEAEALAQQHAFEKAAGGSGFFRVGELDEQPPQIVSRFPDVDGFAIRRFSPIIVSFWDKTGVATESIKITINDGNSYTLADPELSWNEGKFVFDLGGDVALGNFGASVDVEITVADVLGNAATYSWGFDLEVAPVVEESIFLFGSPDALRAGQRLHGASAEVARAINGPIHMSDPVDTWNLVAITADSIVIDYDRNPPAFAINDPLANLAPGNVSEIFYRRVVSIQNDAAEKRLVLNTLEVSVDSFITDGSFILDANQPLFVVGEDGTLSTAIQPASEAVIPLHHFSHSFENEMISQPGIGAMTAKGGFDFRPEIRLSRERRGGETTRFSASLAGELWTQLEADLNLEIDGYQGSWDRKLYEKTWHKVGFIGKVPVYAKITFDVTAEARVDLSSAFHASARFSHTVQRSYGVSYDRSAQPKIQWSTTTDRNQLPYTHVSPVEWSGDASASLHLVPRISVGFFNVWDFHLGKLEACFDASISANGSAEISGSKIQTASAEFKTDGRIRADFSAPFLDKIELLNDPVPFFQHSWRLDYPEVATLRFVQNPTSTTAIVGQPFSLNVQANGPSQIQYEWFKDGRLDQHSGSTRIFPNARLSDAGSYQVVARSGGQSITSNAANVLVVPLGGGPTDPNMIPVQGGTLAMSMGTVTVDTFEMGKFEVTWGEWKAVRADATARGYDIGNIGAGCADNHPVHTVNWYDVVKWCNLKSEIEGLTPIYTLSGATYKSGQSIPAQNLSASGYRLPLEAEWEFAARGGIHSTPTTYSGSNTIGAVAWFWDNSAGAACPLWNNRGTWPVGGKASNELGLHDMSGNVWEWCWDANGSFRRVRGGGWSYYASGCTVSGRNNGVPDARSNFGGFRLARSSGN